MVKSEKLQRCDKQGEMAAQQVFKALNAPKVTEKEGTEMEESLRLYGVLMSNFKMECSAKACSLTVIYSNIIKIFN